MRLHINYEIKGFLGMEFLKMEKNNEGEIKKTKKTNERDLLE